MTPLRLQNVRKTRGHGRRAVEVLRGVSMQVEPGEVVLLEGPSGAGKTTLLAVAAGLLLPDSGKTLLEGQSLAALGAAARRSCRARRVGFVFQRANLLAGLTVMQNVLLAAVLADLPADQAAREAATLLDQLGIGALAQRYPRELSGGEEQRVAVARALVHQPAVVLADEPTGNLDGESGRAVSEALAAIASLRHASVVIATHDARLRPIATRRLRIEDGCIVPESASPGAGQILPPQP